MRISIVTIDDFLTSQVYAECHRRTLINLTDRNTLGTKIHAVSNAPLAAQYGIAMAGRPKNPIYFRIYGAQ
jgi:hypothetical protein